MKGRHPKDPDLRRRANKASTAAVLEAQPDAKPPPLPKRLFPSGTIHPNTRKWWVVIWRSPMAPRWLDADIEGLYLVAILRNEFFMKPTATVAAEIRQQETRFGLDVLSRRRLDWRIQQPSPADDPEEPATPEIAADDFDPRNVLRAVK